MWVIVGAEQVIGSDGAGSRRGGAGGGHCSSRAPCDEDGGRAQVLRGSSASLEASRSLGPLSKAKCCSERQRGKGTLPPPWAEWHWETSLSFRNRHLVQSLASRC